MPVQKMLNIGCGARYHTSWINLDVMPADRNVLKIDINHGLPFPDGFAEICYSSHVLEHLDIECANKLIGDCFRVLKHGGVIRLVLPDLEKIAREYLNVLDAVTSGDKAREVDYDWIMLELYDQAVRNSAGGEMARFLSKLDTHDRSFVRSRIGFEADKFWSSKEARHNERKLIEIVKQFSLYQFLERFRLKIANGFVYLIAGKAASISFKRGCFRDGGEVHKWMYDRYSLKRMLVQAGFVDIKICFANESRIPEFGMYSLDVLNGIPIKPDSLYIEASKP